MNFQLAVPCKNFSIQWKFSSRWVSEYNIQERKKIQQRREYKSCPNNI